jgi:hypothetical protein
MRVDNGPGKISYTIHCTHATIQHFQNALAYSVTVVSYTHKMFMKSTPGSDGLCLGSRS